MSKGWKQESTRHSLARKKIKTSRDKSGIVMMPTLKAMTVFAKNQETGKKSQVDIFLPESAGEAGKLSDELRTNIITALQNKQNWKLPPEPVYTKTEDYANTIASVFTYYLGGAEITPVKDGFKVTSKGYYYYIGG